jgi:hypothetical protein
MHLLYIQRSYRDTNNKNKLVVLVREWTNRPSDRRLLSKLVPTFTDRGMSSARRIPYGHNLGFLDRSRYFSFQVAPQMYSRSWVDSVPNPLLLRKSGNVGNRTRTSSYPIFATTVLISVHPLGMSVIWHYLSCSWYGMIISNKNIKTLP